jgi:hypothetical protein
VGKDAGAHLSRGSAGDVAIEDELDFLGTTEIEFLADDLLENMRPCAGWPSTWVKENSACRIDMS